MDSQFQAFLVVTGSFSAEEGCTGTLLRTFCLLTSMEPIVLYLHSEITVLGNI